ncbi:hypothetical protein MBAV_001225, partial [Candidatus Magnetobacterium bavaricum]
LGHDNLKEIDILKLIAQNDSLHDLYQRVVAIYHRFFGVKPKAADKETNNR